MPEQQEPFIHQDGKTILRRPRPGELTSNALARLVNALGELRQREGQGDPRLANARREPLAFTIAILAMLREPNFNSAAIGFAALPPAEAALIGDLAATLLATGTARPRLVQELRALLERYS